MWRWWLFVTGAVVLELVAGAVGFLWFQPALPQAVARQIAIKPIVPHGPHVRIDRSSIAYTPSSRVLSYYAYAFGNRITVNQQPTPDYFTQTPGAYASLRTAMNTYGQIKTPAGIVYLAKPQSMGGRQVAILNIAGTLVFVRPDTEFNNDQWTRFFSSLQLHQ